MINGPIWDESRLEGNSPTILAIGDSWFWYPMDKAMIHRELQQSVVNNLLEAFSKRLDDVAKECANIHCVNCLGTLKPEEWANELHPIPTGFNKLARKWTPVLQAAGLIP